MSSTFLQFSINNFLAKLTKRMQKQMVEKAVVWHGNIRCNTWAFYLG